MRLIPERCLACVKENKWTILLCLIIFSVMLTLSAACGYVTDDLHFRFVWQDFYPLQQGDDRIMSSLTDVLESVRNYYTYSGGRVLLHGLTFILCNLNKWVFNILNATVFVCLGLLIYKFVFGERKASTFVLAMIYGTLFVFIPTFGDTVLWLSGSVNYLWSGTLMLLTMLYMRKYLTTNKLSTGLLLIMLTGISAFTNEITGGMLAVWLCINLIAERRKPNLIVLCCFICCIIGELVIITAPGNAYRAEHIDEHAILDVANILRTFLFYVRSMLGYNGLACIATLFLLVLYIIRTRFGNIVPLLPVMITGFAGFSALSLVGVVVVRPLLFPSILMLITFWQLVDHFMQIKDEDKRGDITDMVPAIFIKIAGNISKGIQKHKGITKAVLLSSLGLWLTCNTIQFVDTAEQYRSNITNIYQVYSTTGALPIVPAKYTAYFAPMEYGISYEYTALWLMECEQHDINEYEVARFYGVREYD